MPGAPGKGLRKCASGRKARTGRTCRAAPPFPASGPALTGKQRADKDSCFSARAVPRGAEKACLPGQNGPRSFPGPAHGFRAAGDGFYRGPGRRQKAPDTARKEA